MDLSPGSAFAGYEIRGEIGRGAMGVVYLAYDPKLDREVALKVVAEHLAQDPAFRARFAQEAKAAARVEHPSVVAIYQTGEENGIPFLAMRLVRGRELSAILAEQGSYSVDAAVALLRPIASGLDAAHAANIVHRDVKPANILVPDDGSAAVLVDFGIGRVMQGTRATQTGSWVGTVDYVAPEQIRGGDVDGRADQYALGCVLYEMIAGEPPFRRDDAIQSLFAHANDEPPAVVTPDSAAGERLNRALAMALAKQPSERFSLCADFMRAAGEPVPLGDASIARTGTVIGSPVSLDAMSRTAVPRSSDGVTPPSSPAAISDHSNHAPRPSGKSKRIAVAGSLVILLAVVGAAAVYMVSSSGTTSSKPTEIGAGDQGDGAPEACTTAAGMVLAAAKGLQTVRGGMSTAVDSPWFAARRSVLDAQAGVRKCALAEPAAEGLRAATSQLDDGLAGLDQLATKMISGPLGSDYKSYCEMLLPDDPTCGADTVVNQGFENRLTEAGAVEANAAGRALEDLAVEDSFLAAQP